MSPEVQDRATMALMSSPSHLDVRLRIDFGSTKSIGPSKIALLEQIARSGSLLQAAHDLGISYRRAARLLDNLNRSFSEPVAKANVDPAGDVRLSALGETLIDAFRDVERSCLEVARSRFAGVIKEPEPAKSLKTKLLQLLRRGNVRRPKLPPPRGRAPL
jgi:molybdate transport system regulatory protein